MTVRLRGGRVVLRRFHESELPGMWERELRRGGKGDRDKYFAFLRGSGEWTADELRLAVEVDGALAGDVQARRGRASMPQGVTELGIGLFDEARGKGVGTEVLTLLCRHLFDDEGFHRVQLSTDVDNVAMRRCAQKAGFTEEGVLRGFWRTDDGLRDYVMCGRTLDDHRSSG